MPGRPSLAACCKTKAKASSLMLPIGSWQKCRCFSKCQVCCQANLQACCCDSAGKQYECSFCQQLVHLRNLIFNFASDMSCCCARRDCVVPVVYEDVAKLVEAFLLLLINMLECGAEGLQLYIFLWPAWPVGPALLKASH